MTIYTKVHSIIIKVFHSLWRFNDASFLNSIVAEIKPHEIYNLAAQSHVKVSFDIPDYTTEVNSLGTLRILEAIKNSNLIKKTKFYQASTSELYGGIYKKAINENFKFYPKSPYGVSKLYSYWITKVYKESYGLFACNGILFNHESPRRGETFVTRKITKGLVNVYLGKENCIYLGNLDSQRDWGHARDYVYMQWLMLQQKKPDDKNILLSTSPMRFNFTDLSISSFISAKLFTLKFSSSISKAISLKDSSFLNLIFAELSILIKCPGSSA